MKNITTQNTSWGTIVVSEFRVKIGELQKRILGLHFDADYADYIKTSVVYRIGAREYYALSEFGEPFTLSVWEKKGDRNINVNLGTFPDRATMTKWVKSHLR